MSKNSNSIAGIIWNRVCLVLSIGAAFLPSFALAQLPGGGLEGGGGGGGGGGGPYPFQWNYFHFSGLEAVPSSTLIKFKYTLDHNWLNPTGTPFAPYIQATMGGTNTSETKLLLSSDLTAGYHEVTFDCQVDNGLGTVQLFMIPIVVDEHDGVMQHFETHGDSVTLTSPLLGVIGNILLPTAPPCIPCGVKTSPSGLNLLPYLISMDTNDFQLRGMLKSSFQPPCEACAKKGGSAKAILGGGPSSGSGCGSGSCGGGGETNPTPILLPVEPKPFVEYSIYHSAFGPGMMSGVDASLYMVASAPGSNANYTARLFDPNLGVATLFQDVTSSNPTGDNILHDALNRYDRMVKSGNTATVYYHDGSHLVFALEDNDLDTTDKQGALTAMVNRDGEVQYEIYYSDRPNRIIAYVKDKYGYQIDFTYGPMVAGRKAVSSLSFCNGTVVSFGYANDFLSSVSMPEGWAWTCAVGFDATSQAVTLTVNGPEHGIQKHFLSANFMQYQNQLYGQPSNLLRLVLDKDGNPVVGVFHNPNNNDEILKLYAGNKLSMLKPARSERFATSWTFIPSGNPGWNSFQNLVFENELAHGGKGYSSIAGEAEQQMLKTTPAYIRSITGQTTTLGYDSDGYIVEETYPDASTITYQLDDYKNVLRMKDRRGNVTLMEYNSGNHMTRRREGMIVVNGADVPGPEYGEYNYVWSGSNLISERDPLSTGAGSTMHRTDYEYSGAGQLTKVIQASDTEGGPRGSTTYTYNTCGLVTSITDAGGHITSFDYDGLGRIIKTTYQDQTTDTVTYGTGALVHYPIRVKNRANVVTSLEYDLLKRLIKRTEASHTEPTPGNLVANSDVNQKNITDYTYGSNSRIVIEQISNGRKTMSQYDYRHRVIESKSWPYAGTMLSTKTNYLNNRVFYTEDAYGRREYMGYSVSNASELIRRVTTGPADYAIADFPAVLDLNRLSAPAAVVSIADAIKDSNGNLKEVIDGRGIVTKYEYDSRDREIRRKDAFGTPVEAITETSYDAVGNVTEVRSPRYFDSSDSQKDYMKTLFTYTGRGAQKTQTVAPGGSAAEALTSQTYDLEGKVATSTDASGNVWTNDYSDDCCGHFSGRIDPLGHGSMTNMDAMGRVVHSATVKDYSTHTLKSDPVDAKTLAESTTRYDLLGRTRARTTWLTALGPINKENPQIAGYDSIPLAQGLTSQVYYDVNLKDGIGLDGTGGLMITKMTGSAPGETFTITSAQFAAVMNKLAEPIANGGAGLTFTSNESAPSAVISVNAEDELSVSISDGMGRGVMTAQIQPWDGPQPFTLVTWSCQKHDTIYNLAGVGNVLESISIDANGKTVKSHSDGAGRTLQTVDQLGKISTSTYDSAGNVLSVRDPNGVGYDAVYDQLGRMTSQTDTFGDVTSSTYDKGGNVKTRTDAKGKVTTMVYDAQNRLKTTTDRLGGVTTNNFNCCRLASIVDAEGQMTSYTYNTRGEKIKETYPDHVNGSAVGTSGYGIVEFLFDEAGRLKRKTDQAGDTCTFIYDLAGRVLQKDYRTMANSPSGIIADSDVFTLDKASRMLTAVSGRYSNTIANVFDPLGRHMQEKLTVAGQTYTITHDFDSLGRPFKMTYPDSTVTEKTFTDRGQLSQIKYGGSVIDTRTYDDAGRLSNSTYSNGAGTTYNFRSTGSSKDNMLASIVTTNPGTDKVGTYAYIRDANKNKTAETITNSPLSGYGFSTGTAGYDDENRVTAWNRSDNDQNQTWNLSIVGDWNTFNQTGASPLTQTRTHGPTHEFTSFTGTNSGAITYDVKGNMTSRPSSLQSPALNLAWDFDNKLKGADTDNTPATFEVAFGYDALGRRVSRSESGNTVIYLQSGQQTIADYTSGAVPASPTYRYVYGSYIDEPILRESVSGSIKLFFHRNQQYSIAALTDITGNTVERYAYTCYGGLSVFDSSGSLIANSALNNRYTYTGREWDPTLRMFYFRARWLDGTAGRFVGRDPLGFVDGPNLYDKYFGASLVDPTGAHIQGLQEKSPIEIPFYLPLPFWNFPFDMFYYDHMASKAKKCVFVLSGHDLANLDKRGGFDGIQATVIPIPYGKTATIPEEIKQHQCCELMFLGHQGAGVNNHGGIIETRNPDKFGDKTEWNIVLPNDELEKEISIAIGKVGCSKCRLFLYACGPDHPDADPRRQSFANKTGCTVYGTKRNLKVSTFHSFTVDRTRVGCHTDASEEWKSETGAYPARNCGLSFMEPLKRYVPTVGGGGSSGGGGATGNWQ